MEIVFMIEDKMTKHFALSMIPDYIQKLGHNQLFQLKELMKWFKEEAFSFLDIVCDGCGKSDSSHLV